MDSKISQYLILTFLIALLISCGQQNEKKRKIKLSQTDQIQSNHDQQSTVLKFDAQEKRSIAVLTFENRTGKQELEWLSKGITDMLIRDISQSNHLNVVTLQRIFDIFKQLKVESPGDINYQMISAIGKKANVEAIIKGYFSTKNDSLIIDVELFHVKSNALFQNEQVTGSSLEEIFGMVDELTDRIKNDLRVTLAEADETNLAITEISTHSIEAYRNYTEGVELLYKAYIGDAIKKFESAIKIDSTFAMAHFYAAITYPLLEKMNEANQAIKKAVKYSNNVTPKEKMKIDWIHAAFNHENEKAFQLLQDLVKAYPEDKELQYQLAGSYFYDEKMEEAKEHLNYVLTLDSSYVQAYNLLSIIHRRNGNYKNAIKLLKKYIRHEPNDAAPHHNLAEIYEALGDNKSAVEYYEKALSVKPDFHYSILNLANMYSKMGDYDKARKKYLSAIDVVPSEELKAQVFAGLARVDVSLGKFRDAIRQLDNAAQSQSSEKGKANYLVMKAGIYLKKAVFDSAISLSQKALSFQKNNVSAFAMISRAYIKTGQVDSAKRVANKIDRYIKEMKLGIIRNVHADILAEIAVAEERYNDAIEIYLKILQETPEATSVNMDCGKIYFKMGKPKLAIEHYQKYIEKNPNNALAFYHQALAFHAINQLGDAKKSMKKFLTIWENADSDIPELISGKQYLNEWENKV